MENQLRAGFPLIERASGATKIDGFLKIDKIKGESTRDGHEDEIEIYDVTWSVNSPYDTATRARQGRASMGLVTCYKDLDVSSVYFAQAVWNNDDLGDVQIACRRTIDGETVDYFIIKLKETQAVSYAFAASQTNQAKLQDFVCLAYSGIEFAYDTDHTAAMDWKTGK